MTNAGNHLFAHTGAEDPSAAFARLHSTDPVHWSDSLRCWVLTRYEDVARALRDPRFAVGDATANAAPARDPLARLRRRMLVFVDPPAHDRLRRYTRAAFSPPRVRALRHRVEAITDEILDGVERVGRTELVGDLAYALPVRVISEILGVEAEALDELRERSDDLARSLVELDKPPDALPRALSSLVWLCDRLGRVIAERRLRPRDDVASTLVVAEAAGGLDAEEILATCVLLLLAGHETTASLIGNGVAALLAHPGARARLVARPALIESAVEEFLRFESPVRTTRRIARRPLVLRGRRIERGDRVLAVLAAANRDPAVFAEPDRLEIGRAPNPHLAFGHGLHFCLGTQLARLEARVAIGTFVRRFPHFALDREAPRWKRSANLRGLASLALRV